MDRLKDVMWNMFQDTGNIDAYLFYRRCNPDDGSHQGSSLASAGSDNQEMGYKN